MNILLINHYAGSPNHGMEYRPYYMAREWIREGHDVTIVAASFSHLRSQQPKVSGGYTEELKDGIRYIWLLTPAYKGNGFGRVKNMLAFILQLYRRHSQIIKDKKFDLVIASSTYPLDIYPAKFIADKTRAKLIYEVHDLWPLSPMELGKMSKYHPFIMVMQAAENYAYRVVDKVVSMLPKAEPHMLSHGLSYGKFNYIPNGIDIAEWEDNKSHDFCQLAETLNQMKENNKFIVGYAGGHAVSNALCFLLEAAAEITDKNIVFVLIGAGSEKQKLQQEAVKKGLENFFFFSAVKKEEIPQILSIFDILYIGWNKVSLYRFGICPNKLFDYMMSGKPIIHSVEAGNDLVAESGCGISVPAECPKAILKAILNLKDLTESARLAMGMRGKAYVVKYHDYRVLAKRFIDCINEEN